MATSGKTPDRSPVRTRRWRIVAFAAVLATVVALLFGIPSWILVLIPSWPVPVTAAGVLAFGAGAIAMPVLLYQGHARGRDRAARTAGVLLGAIWVLFAWSVIGALAGLALRWLGGAGLAATRGSAVAVLAVSAGLLAWGHHEAVRVPRIRKIEVYLPGLGPGLDGARVVLLADTHYGPLDRSAWSAQVVEAVNALDPDLVCHTGDLADGTVAARRDQVEPLRRVRARLARAYVPGNHENFADAGGWLHYLTGLGWVALPNRHIVVERDGARLVLAGVGDRTGRNQPGYGADHAAALRGAPAGVPVLLLAHQPKQITAAVRHGVALQLSGHTHGGQIWPFHLLVRLDQPVLAGLSRHGERTQLYTSRGAGFWGPPFRIFAPSEITLLVLRAAAGR